MKTLSSLSILKNLILRHGVALLVLVSGFVYPVVSQALTVSVTGTGQVVSIPAGITCGNGATTCTANFAAGTNVVLGAVAGSGTGLSSWGGICSGRDLKCRVNNTAGSVTATFSSNPAAMATVTGGGYHSCGLSAAGGVKCWGYSLVGQSSTVPVPVAGLASGVVAVESGTNHDCALTSLGAVKCWGSGLYGQLGDNTSTNSSAPVQVTGLTSGVVAIAAGGGHSCALTTAGGVQCWGYGGRGELGNNTLSNSPVPVPVNGLSSGVIAISSSADHTCALTSAGGVQCWGWNLYGQLGNSSNVDSSIPVQVTGLTSGVAGIAVGSYMSCALTSTGAVKCWGDNSSGSLGNNSTVSSSVPVPVSGLTSGVTSLFAGSSHSCALTSAGAVQCWGNNFFGQLGNNTTTNALVPAAVTGLASGVTAIGGGDLHSCALTSAGAVQCWGYNGYGQLGNNTAVDTKIPALAWTSSLAITVSGPGTVTSSPAGISCGATCSAPFAAGTSVVLTAAPSGVATFSGWSGGGCSGTGTCTTTVSGASTVSAAFTQVLTVSKTGNGTITSTPAGINCGATCSAPFAIGSSVTLTAAPSAGSVLTGWSGGCSGVGPTCTITMDAATTVGATFSTTPPLTVSLSGGGSVASSPVGISCGASCTANFALGSTVTLTATPAVGQVFTGWSGFCAGTSTTCTVAMNMVSNVTATFAQPTLTVTNLGSGTVTSNVAGINCGVTCSAPYNTGTVVTLTATPTSGYTFTGWSGSGCSGRGTCALTLNASTNVWANFTPTNVAWGVSSGTSHTCAITSAGGVKCWGLNANGQLGNNSLTTSLAPVDVSGLSSGVVAVAAGGNHSCALTSAGAVQCWGMNISGQLGNNTTTQSPVPVAVSGLSTGVVAIAAGANHTCALTSAGAVKCWGLNSSGQLGNASTVQSNIPVQVSGLTTGIVGVSAGGSHSCAFNGSGVASCWGLNTNGQLGNNTTTNASSPVSVSNITGIKAISSGSNHNCALTSSGAIQCWGANVNGQLGNNSTTQSSVPVQVSGLSSGMVGVSSGGSHSCGLTAAGGAQCWGLNINGQLGNNSTTQSNVPVSVTGLASGLAAVSAGGNHTCALTSNGGINCWGLNANGQLGNISTGAQFNTPVATSGFSAGFSALAAGANHSCSVTSSGGAQCWGWNGSGQLGNGNTVDSHIPVSVSNLGTGVTAVTGGYYHSCALLSAGTVQCWGGNGNGQLGNNTTTQSFTPVAVTGLTGVVAIAAGDSHTCARTSAGGVQCWGDNTFGQLGNLSNTESHIPVSVNGLSTGVVAIASAGNHTCALTTAGAVKCWGWNTAGQLGNNTTNDSNLPVAVTGLSSGVASISAGSMNSCAVTTTGGALCWGNNADGELGSAVSGQSMVPVGVTGMSSGVASVAMGGDHACALTTAGSVQCWGYNAFGQIGNNSGADSSWAPVQVFGLTSGVTKIASGGSHSCALKGSSIVQCWGFNAFGQLGNNLTSNAYVPSYAQLETVASVQVTVNGTGSVTPSPLGASCGNNCYTYPPNTNVTLTPNLLTGSTFSWGGACTGSASCTLNVGGPVEVTANFSLPVLTVAVTGTGTISSNNSSTYISCASGSMCFYSLQPSEIVSLFPDATSGNFTGWTGACIGTVPCNVAMDASKAITANFAAVSTVSAPLSVSVSGTGSVISNPVGINSPDVNYSQIFPAGTSVTLTAVTPAGQQFDGWFGDCLGTASTCTLASPNGKSVTASFSPLSGLGVSVYGTGSVTSSPAGINCTAGASAGCSKAASASTVTLTATPLGAGISFAGWSGGCSGTAATCTLPANYSGTVTATFGSVCILPAVSGTGSGSIDSNFGPLPVCDKAGKSINLHAEPNSGSVAAGWGGACTGQVGALCILPFPATTQTASAIFTSGYTASVLKVGHGTGTVTSNLGGLNCGATCSTATLSYNTPVTLTASSAVGSVFRGWQGACTGSSTCVLDMTESPLEVSANFGAPQLTVAVDVGGAVQSTPAGIGCLGYAATSDYGTCSATFPNAGNITLSVLTMNGFTFAGWGGACSGTATTCTLTALTADAVVTAKFTANAGTTTNLLTLNTFGSGTVTSSSISGGGASSSPGGFSCKVPTCTASFVASTSLTLTASADPGYAFTGWAGACTGTTPCTVAMTAAKTVNATFSPVITVVTATSQGTITSTPAGISCGATCSATMLYGGSVSLTATPLAGKAFAGWVGGSCQGVTTTTCTFVANSPMTITATYVDAQVVADGDAPLPEWAMALMALLLVWGMLSQQRMKLPRRY